MKECSVEPISVTVEKQSSGVLSYDSPQTRQHLLRNEKMASVGRLSAGIAHEINNPVGFVSSNTTSLINYVGRIKEILKMYRTGVNKEIIDKRERQLKIDFILEDIDKLLMENLEGLARITTIVNNLKKFSHDNQSDDFIDADINDGLRSVLILVRNESKYYTDIITDFGEIGPIPCNISEINQVFLNIIMNAIEAVKEQHRKEKGLITIKTWIDSDFVCISFTDDGPGIPDEIKDKIFNPFFTTKQPGSGTGLGLSICHDIVINKHGGQIELSSRPGAGTTFIIKLPRSRRT